MFFKLNFSNWDLDSVKSFFITKLLNNSDNPFDQFNKADNLKNDVSEEIIKDNKSKSKSNSKKAKHNFDNFKNDKIITSCYDYYTSRKKLKEKEFKIPNSISSLVNCTFYCISKN